LCPDFNKIFRNKQFIKKVSQLEPTEKNFEEIIEKLVIINLLSYEEFKNFMHSGINPLKELFLGLFKEYSLQKILETYKKYYFIYCEPLLENFVVDLNRIETNETEGRKYLKNYDEQLKEIEKEDRNEILIDKYTLQQYMLFGSQLIMLQISNNIRKRELKGENLISTKLALKKLFVNGIKNKQTLDTYNELVAEANAQLNIFKLPKSYKKFENKVKETLLENYKEMMGENFEEACFEAMKKVQQDMYELNMEEKIIKTGAEPELTVSEIKKDIQRNFDFFEQSKLMENILDKNQEKIKKLRNDNDKLNSINNSKIKDVSINELENEILRLRNKLGIESQQDYYLDKEKNIPNMESVKKKVEEMKSEKFKSITNFKEFNNDQVEQDDSDVQAENSDNKPNISSSHYINDIDNKNFFNEQEKKNKMYSNNINDLMIRESEEFKELKRLEIIRDLKQSLKEEYEEEIKSDNFPELNPINYFNLDIFRGKSLEELKNLEVEELHEAETRVSSDGSTDINQVQVGDSFYKLAQTTALKNSSTINLSEEQAEVNFQMAFNLIKEDLVKKDNERANTIITALENGQYIDDPFYIALLMKSKKYIHLRELHLKKYFRAGNDNSNQVDKKSNYFMNLILGKNTINEDKVENFTNVKTPLLDKYIKKPGDIVDNMLADGIFEKYENNIGKIYVNLFKEYVNDLDEEERTGEKYLNLEEIENDKELKDINQEDGSFNIYDLSKNISEEYDDFHVRKEDLEKELGWKKINNFELEREQNSNKKLEVKGHVNNENSIDAISRDFKDINKNEDYIPGSNRGSSKKKFKKIMNK